MAPRGKKASRKKRSGSVSKKEAKSLKKRKVSLAQADHSRNGQSSRREAADYTLGYSATPARTGRQLPEYNYALGDFLKYGDHLPQKYNDVLTQIYPLQADIGALKDFCDDYLNLTGKWIFEPAAPWVVMQVCNYGKMALLTQSVGWASQHEFAFGFPVAWFERLAHGQRKFRDWAMVYPYIWVDDPLSLSMGRQVYGWAKAGIELKSHRPNLHPDTRCLVSIDRKIGPERYFHDETTRRFLEILQHQPIVSGRTGFATVNSVPPRSMGGYWGALYSMLGTFDSLIAGYEDRLSEYANTGHPLPGLVRESINFGRQSRRWNKYLDVFLSSAQDMTLAQERVLGMPVGRESLEAILDSTRDKIRIITLKQFRDAACPSDACFSAIVGSTLRYGQPIDGGLLRSDPLSPDSSGGILIYLRDDYCIVEELGLRSIAKADDAPKPVHTLRPQMPFWVKVNVSYDAADCQAWRTRYTNWVIDEGWPEGRPEPYQISGGDDSCPDSSDSSQETPPKRADTPAIPDKISPVKYNRRGSGASLEVPGPVKSANFGLLVYALKAGKDELFGLCDKYLNDQPYYQFTPSPPPKVLEGPKPLKGFYVLMLVSSFDEMKGATAGFRNLHDRVLTFAIPAKCTPKTPNGQPSDSGGEDVLIPLYTFVEQDWDFLTENEVYGRLAFKSLLESPPQTWIERAKARRELLTVYTSIFPEAPAKPQRERFKPLIQIWDKSPPQMHKALKLKKDGGEVKVDLIANTYVKWLGLPVPTDAGSPDGQINSICLKQVRDAIQTSRACYQEIVSVIRHIDAGWKYDTSPQDLRVRFYKYPGMTISDTMGIVPDDPKDPEAKYQCWVTAVTGATISGYMSDEDAQNLCWTIEENGWSDDPPPPPPGP